MEQVVFIALSVVGAYTIIGASLLVPFHRRAVPILDESARGASVGFRVVISPGLIALWPVILVKWLAARRGRLLHGSPDSPISSLNIRRMQSLLIKVIAIAVPLLVAAAIASRPAPPPVADVPAATNRAQD